MKTNRSILFLSTSLCRGGAETNMLNIIEHLASKKIGADIMLLKKKVEFFGSYKQLLKKTNIYSVLKSEKKIKRWQLPFISIYIFFKLLLHICQHRYRIIVAVEEFTFFPTIVLSYCTGLKTVLIVGTNIEEEYIHIKKGVLRQLTKAFFRFLLLNATKIVCVSKGVQQQLMDKFTIPSSKISVIYNGVNTTLINSLKTKPIPKAILAQIHGAPICVMLGRLIKRKGHLYGIVIFQEVLRTIPTAKCIIVGAGPEKNSIKSYIEKNSLTKNILMLGRMDNPYRILSRADVFLFPSLHEGFGNAIIEAMTCGLPVVATNCCFGPLEILSEKKHYLQNTDNVTRTKYGILIPSNDSSKHNLQKTAQIIIQLMQNKSVKNYFSRKSIMRSKLYTSLHMSRQYSNLFDQL